MGDDETLAGQHLVAAARLDPAAAAEEEIVDAGRRSGRDRNQPGRRRLVELLEIEGDARHDPRFERGHAGQAGDLAGDALRRAFHRREDVGKPLRL